MDYRLGLVCNLKGAPTQVVTSDTDDMFRRSLLPKPMPIMSTHSLKRKLYAFAITSSSLALLRALIFHT
jgi:hypothetical protein